MLKAAKHRSHFSPLKNEPQHTHGYFKPLSIVYEMNRLVLSLSSLVDLIQTTSFHCWTLVFDIKLFHHGTSLCITYE